MPFKGNLSQSVRIIVHPKESNSLSIRLPYRNTPFLSTVHTHEWYKASVTGHTTTAVPQLSTV